MTSAHVASIESSGSQKRSRRWHHFRPVHQDLGKTERSNNSTYFSHMFNAGHRGGEHYASSWVDVADELTDENDIITRSIDVEHVASTRQNTAGGVQQLDARVAHMGHERSAMPKFHSSLASTVNIGAEEASGVRDKIQSAMAFTMRSFNALTPRFKRPGGNEPIIAERTPQLALPSPEILTHSHTTQHEGPELDEIERLRRDLSESHFRIAELQRRLDAQSRDLENSNSFLNTADKSSDSDVIRALQRLNAEVQQNTTYMADCLVEEFEFENLTTNSTREQTAAAQRVLRRIGSVLMQAFGTNAPEDTPMLLQIAFQAYFVSVLCQATSSWAFEPGYNTFIREIYQKLRRVEAQAIAGRWRTLTHAHSVHGWITHAESLVKGIVTDISDIMLAAGCTAPRSDIITKVASKFEEKIGLLVELAGGLSKTFDEVVSSDFEVFIARPGETFKAVTMEGADSDDGQAGVEGESILCATHIGLTKRVPMGTLWEKGRKQKIMVLKARVLLKSFLDME